PSWEAYGRLSSHSRDELVAGARIYVAPDKKDPADFVLWKPSSEDLPGWDSSWGRGRPGWHIECSAMVTKYLGSSFDIHGGGQDLIFPHHENEIAQCLCDEPTNGFAKYWMHNGYLMSEGEKMSKSLGNFYTINELLQAYPGEAIRLLLIKTHYRQPLDFSRSGLDEAKRELDRFYGALRGLSVDAGDQALDADVRAALSDDLNTPLALSALHAKLRDLNIAEGDAREEVAFELRRAAKVLGLLEQDPEEWFRWAPSAQGGLDDAQIESLIQQRAEARAAKDFATSDRLRDELAEAGIILEDKPEGTIWRRG
ncbi:MAG: DALR domain-containing protein, partial [Pseudomonadota bacterium]|nr:DALR domain-containing protein [Pseudomonadota bacterium]